MESVAVLVPLIVFGSLVIIIALPFYFRHRNRRLVYEAIKTTIENNGKVDPALISAIAQDNIGPNADLRRGILLMALSLGMVLCGLFLPDDISAGIVTGLAFIPGVVGIAQVGFHYFIPREPTV
jgi:fructose-specific phosphotransferase system IIC component